MIWTIRELQNAFYLLTEEEERYSYIFQYIFDDYRDMYPDFFQTLIDLNLNAFMIDNTLMKNYGNLVLSLSGYLAVEINHKNFPFIFERDIASWFRTLIPKYEKLANTLTLIYNPIDNYNMSENYNEYGETDNGYTEQLGSRRDYTDTTYGKQVNTTNITENITNGQQVNTTNEHIGAVNKSITDNIGGENEIEVASNKSNIGARVNEKNLITDDILGSKTDTNNQTTTTDYGKINNTTTKSKSAYDISDLITTDSENHIEDTRTDKITNNGSITNGEQNNKKTETGSETIKATTDITTTSISKTKNERVNTQTIKENEKTNTLNSTIGERKDIISRNNTLTRNEYTDNQAHNIGEQENAKQGYNNSNLTHTLTRKGNIGVTTTQQMINSERDIACFNLIQTIAIDFVDNFCIRNYNTYANYEGYEDC